MPKCAICFENIEKNGVRCTDPNCITFVCSDCINQYVNIVSIDNSKLSCPRTDCTGEYDEKSLKNQSNECKKLYRNYIIKYFLNTHGEAVNKLIAKKNTFEKMHEERRRFYAENLPKAVRKVAEIAFKSRLSKVKKEQVETNVESTYTRKCFNLFCNGFLSEELTCSKCTVSFCKLCECMKNANHECDKDIVENVKYIASLTVCPKCKTPIEKGIGCMAMTCAVCFTNFWYNSGEKSEFGNHNQSKKVTINDSQLSNTHFKIFSDLGILGNIRLLEHEYKKQPLDQLNKYSALFCVGLDINDKNRQEFSRLYSDFARHSINNVTIGKKLGEIENLITKKPDDWDNKIKMLVSDQPVVISRVISRSVGFVVVDYEKTAKSMDEALEYTMNSDDFILE